MKNERKKFKWNQYHKNSIKSIVDGIKIKRTLDIILSIWNIWNSDGNRPENMIIFL